MSSPFPLATADDLRGELAEIDEQLMNLGAGGLVDVQRLEELRRILESWKSRLSDQLARLEAVS